ncbi:MAG: archease [Thermoplasmata archaeon]
MKYKLLEHTADAMVEVYGKDLEERFSNAAYAMFDQITDVTKVRPKGELKVVLSANSREQLLVDFLQELLYVHDVEDLVLCEFKVKIDGKTLEAVVRGERFDEQRHPKRAIVKGVAYHKLEFDDRKGTITVLFDV